MTFARTLLPLAAAVVLCPAHAAEPTLDTARIDAVFAAFTDKTPGCALNINARGRSVYAKGYGLADLNHGVPIRPDTVFDIGSTSKQFTALSLLLLEQDGKLKLDDPLSQHLPELDLAFAKTVTLRQLLNHTAGLPDYTVLMELGGHALENVTGNPEALRALRAAPQLNFKPGSRFSYSNSGYFLAALVAERVAGQSLDALLQARVFKPLGMVDTHVRTDHTQVVARRATAYGATESGRFQIQMSNWNQPGDGAIQSTVIDLGHWDAELAQPKVLSAQLLQALRTPGRLEDGAATPYGLGQMVDRHKGLARFHHGGVWAGYRAITLHYPQSQLGLAVLCNQAEAHTPQLADRLSEILLQAEMSAATPASKPAEPQAAVSASELKALEGRYLAADSGQLMLVQPDARRPGQLEMRAGPGGAPLRALNARELESLSGSTHISLSADGQQLVRTRRIDGSRTVFTRLPAFQPDAGKAKAWAGAYRQPGLGVQWQIRPQADGSLHLQAPGLEPNTPLELLSPDLALGQGFVLRLQRDSAGKAKGLVYRNERVNALRFERG